MFHLYFSGRSPYYKFMKLIYCRHSSKYFCNNIGYSGLCVCDCVCVCVFVCLFLMLDYSAVNSSTSESSGH